MRDNDLGQNQAQILNYTQIFAVFGTSLIGR